MIADGKGGHIRLDIFVSEATNQRVSKVAVAQERTGIAGVVGNKGGVCVRLNVGETSIAFLSAHLAAHQTKKKWEKRNSDVAEIFNGIFFDQMDVVNQFNHVFFMGDLNYRLNYGDQAESKEPSLKTFKEMVVKIEKNELAALFKTDQLRISRDAKKVFWEWIEGDCTKHRPTFKCFKSAEAMEKEIKKEDKGKDHHHEAPYQQKILKDIQYNSTRSPAWCDRILWRSIKIPGITVRQTSLASAEYISGSDHKPVVATFDVDCIPEVPPRNEKLGDAHISFVTLKGKNLMAADTNGFSDPYMLIMHPLLLKETLKTKTINKTLNPVWDPKTLPRLDLLANSAAYLQNQYIMFKLYDKDLTSKDDLIGFANVPLSACVEAGLKKKTAKFEVSVEKGGLPFGTLSGELKLEWEAHK